MISIFLKQSKTDKFSNGVAIYIGCSGHVICAHCLMLKFVLLNPDKPKNAPLFADQNVWVLYKSYFVNATRLTLSAIGLDPSGFSGHSFRAGSATTGADNGFHHLELKMLGWWSSECYNVYLRNPRVASNFAKRLASSHS